MEIELVSVDSTNDYAKRNCHTFPKNEITAIIAQEQIAGRGRENRNWISPPNGNLYLTLCTFMDAPNPNLAQLLSLAAHRLIPALSIKWPNDLLLNGKKEGGILAEYYKGFAINGIGLNIPSIGEVSKKEFVPQLITEYQELLKREFPYQEYRKALLHQPGDPLQFHVGTQKISTTFLSLEPDGSILVEHNGKKKKFLSGRIID